MFEMDQRKETMTSLREAVMIDGRLVGMDRDERCLISAIKVSFAGTSVSAYSRMDIADAPDDLPEVPYTLHYEGQTVNMVKRNGDWFGA